MKRNPLTKLTTDPDTLLAPLITALVGLLTTSAMLVGSPVHAAQPVESGAGRICGSLKSFHGEVQVFDSTRTRLGDAAFGTKLRCGDWISVDQGKAMIEHFSGAAVGIAENGFLQILDPQSGENADHVEFVLYRGEIVVSAPSTRAKPEITIATPNAIVRVKEGTAFALYSTSAEETQAVGLGGRVTLENRFFPGRKISAGFAQMTAFANPVERLVPEEPRYANARDLNPRLERLGIPEKVREGVAEAVRTGAKARMPVTLASTRLLHGGHGELGSARSRAPASAHEKPAASPVAAAVKAPKPAKSSKSKVVAKKTGSSEPDYRLKRPDEDASEKQKLLQALNSMRIDEE